MGSPFRISGTPSMALTLPTRASSFSAYSGSFQASDDLDHPVFQRDASNQSPPTGVNFRRLLVPEVGWIDIHLARRVTVDVSVPAKDLASARRIAQTHRRRDQRFEHRIEVEGCPADRLEHVGGGGLLLKRFLDVARSRLHLVE